MKKIAVLTSGGDSPGMNAAIRAVVRCGLDRDMEVYGIKNGFEGLLDGEIDPMNRYSVGDILQRGGTKLRSARSARFMEDKWVDHGAEMLRTFGIEGLVVIGGNGSLKGGLELSKRGIKIMGVPGTIDNDLGYTDYTIGFDTAVNTVLDAITKIRDTSSAHNRTTIIEVMGRDCGDIALFSGLAGGAEYVIVP
ncbi:MAG: ATP-dependent 6-phosphofructokinase, partial [Firmicutes bacterium]|nr:ATP-dependent 6-phosphofructokinase [Bacillota bacterium]